MANTTTSPNMNLIIPTVSTDPGPDWATNLNASLTLIDQHDHSSGSGVQISQNGITLFAVATSFNSLSFNNSNAYALRSLRFQPQVSALALGTDIGCLYEAGVDLYYNDGSGNQVRITSGGAVTGSAGTITGLPSGTASASYSAGTFIFQSATLTAANIDAGSYILRNATASSKGLTLQPPNAMAADYSLTLPSVPGSTSIVTLDSSGNFGVPAVYPITTAGIATNAGILKSQLAALGQQISAATTLTQTTSSTFQDGASISITTSGRPVFIAIISDGSGSAMDFGANTAGNGMNIRILRGVTEIARYRNNFTPSGSRVLCGTFCHIDPIGAGTYTYKVQINSEDNATIVSLENYKISAYEL